MSNYKFVDKTVKEQVSSSLLNIIEKETGKKQSDFSITSIFKEIKIDEYQAAEIVIKIEEEHNVKITSPPAKILKYIYAFPKPSQEELKKMNFISRLGEKLLDKFNYPIPIYQGSGFPDSCCLMSAQDILLQTYNQIEEREREREREVLKN